MRCSTGSQWSCVNTDVFHYDTAPEIKFTLRLSGTLCASFAIDTFLFSTSPRDDVKRVDAYTLTGPAGLVRRYVVDRIKRDHCEVVV